jgi:hypothetical protein
MRDADLLAAGLSEVTNPYTNRHFKPEPKRDQPRTTGTTGYSVEQVAEMFNIGRDKVRIHVSAAISPTPSGLR